VGFGNFRHHANGVGEILLFRQHCSDTATGKATMTDFPATGATDTTALTYGVGREVVVKHKVVFATALEGIDILGIAQGTQCCRNDGLGFTAGKQGGAVNLGKNANLYADGTHGFLVAAIDARLAANNAAADNFLLQFLEGIGDIFSTDSSFVAGELGNGFSPQGVDRSGAGLFVGGGVGAVEAGAHFVLRGAGQVNIFRSRLP